MSRLSRQCGILNISRPVTGRALLLYVISYTLSSPVTPCLQPYPSWDWQGTEGNCSGLVSVYRARQDRCNRLWVLDSGVITTLDNYSPVCQPKILVFDLKTDTLLRNIILPREVSIRG
jgi:hypothetical protein